MNPVLHQFLKWEYLAANSSCCTASSIKQLLLFSIASFGRDFADSLIYDII